MRQERGVIREIPLIILLEKPSWYDTRGAPAPRSTRAPGMPLQWWRPKRANQEPGPGFREECRAAPAVAAHPHALRGATGERSRVEPEGETYRRLVSRCRGEEGHYS